MNQAHDTLENVQKIWSRPVHLDSALESKGKAAKVTFIMDGSITVPDLFKLQ